MKKSVSLAEEKRINIGNESQKVEQQKIATALTYKRLPARQPHLHFGPGSAVSSCEKFRVRNGKACMDVI